MWTTGVQGFDTLPYQLDNVQLNVQWLLFPIISEYYNIIEELYQELSDYYRMG